MCKSGNRDIDAIHHMSFLNSLECEFPITVIKGKPVFVRDELYVEVDSGWNKFTVCAEHTAAWFSQHNCSWNPPKPKTVMDSIYTTSSGEQYDLQLLKRSGIIEAVDAERKEAKRLLCSATGLPADIESETISRAVDCIIRAAVLEISVVIKQEPKRVMKKNEEE